MAPWDPPLDPPLIHPCILGNRGQVITKVSGTYNPSEIKTV